MRKILVAAFAVFAGIVGSAGFAEERINPFKQEFVVPDKGVNPCETIDILKNEYPKWNKTKIWHPTAGKGEIVANPAQVISYADKWTRHDFGGHGGAGGSCSWRYSKTAVTDRVDPVENFLDYDVDGNGKVDDGEVVRAFPFSMTQPMATANWPFSGTFPDRTSYMFYGGASCYLTHAPDKGKGEKCGGFAELGINPDHNNTWFDQRAEDHPFNMMPNAKHPKSYVQAYQLLVWDKKDFLNLPDQKYKVTFDENSVIASTPCRVYWVGFHDSRVVVKDGDDWYISDNKQITFPASNGYGKRTDGSQRGGIAAQVKPTEATWTRYYPESYKIHLDHNVAKYEKHEFKDVQAIGYYFAKDRKTIGEQAHLKWFGAGAKAVINRPEQGSVNIEMKELKGNDGDFYMSTCEVPYALYKKIHKWGDAPFHSLEARYVYRTHADMGSMTYGNQKHVQDEPATNIEWYDALAFCNTISEHEGKEPVYYLDPEFKTIFRGNHLTTKAVFPAGKAYYKDWHDTNPVWNEIKEPKIHVKWAADGHRLPTASEWELARGQKSEVRGQETEGTVAVGSGEANANGLYDMNGNVWELVWTHGDVYDPANSAVTALGGGFQQTENPAEKALSQYGDTPWNGNGNIGIRLVRRKAGLGKPKGREQKSEIRSWTFRKGERTQAIAKAEMKSDVLEMLKIPAGEYKNTEKLNIKIQSLYAAKYETTYSKWQEVLEWAEANGYEFSKNGDMGSMYYYGYPHEPSEPVAEITWYDMVIWCNALSEMEGKTPVFYTDEAKTTVMRKAPVYRPIKVDTKAMFDPDKNYPETKFMGRACNHPHLWYFIKWDVDGYRLPTVAEFEYMLNGGQETATATKTENNWNIYNSGGRTHPVGQKKPNEYGLYDIAGNVYEWSLGTSFPATYKKQRPAKLDVNNPKQNVTLIYGVKGATPCVNQTHMGGSWLVTNGGRGSSYRNPYDYYPDFGFRVIRCDTGTHPEDGKEELKSSLLIELNPAHFNNCGK